MLRAAATVAAKPIASGQPDGRRHKSTRRCPAACTALSTAACNVSARASVTAMRRRPFTSGLPKMRNCVRSEEHTSELQSLMRISYAVFCLKKKKQTTTKRQLQVQYHTHHNEVRQPETKK